MEKTQNPIENNIQAIAAEQGMRLEQRPEGLTLVQADGQELRGDFVRLIPRLKGGALSKELLVRVSKIKDTGRELTAIDATAGLGDDSFFLAAAGFEVTMYERNPIIFALLNDAIERAKQVPELASIAGRMHAVHADSIEEMKRLGEALVAFDEADIVEAAEAENDGTEDGAKSANRLQAPDIVLLDPMFPERQKSALVKKKLQMIQKLETPCDDEIELVKAAMGVRPKKLVIKRPPKGPYLADIKPDHSLEGKAVRFDCIVSPYDRIHKFFK